MGKQWKREKLYYTKALSDQASSLAPDWILLLRGPRILVYSCSHFGAPPNKVSHCFHCFHCFHCYPIYFPWNDGTGCHDLSFLNVEFKPTFSFSSFTFIKSVFSSSLSAVNVASSAYLRLLIFLPAILIPACASSSPAFLIMYSAYKLNKQGDNIPDLPVAPQDEAGLTKTFQTWPRGWFHIP